MQALNGLLGKASHLRVLRALHRAGQPLSGREVQRRADMSNRAVMLALEELTRLNVVICDAHADHHAYQINPRHFFWKRGIRPALEAEEHFWDDLRRLVRRTLNPRPIAAIVTGPIARDEAETDETLQLHLLFETGRERLQSYRGLDKLREQTETRYSLGVHATFMDLRNMDDPEFRTLWRRIAREGVLLFGDLPVTGEDEEPREA
jgi:hypothetical protein